jgi:hypothetical protein
MTVDIHLPCDSSHHLRLLIFLTSDIYNVLYISNKVARIMCPTLVMVELAVGQSNVKALGTKEVIEP